MQTQLRIQNYVHNGKPLQALLQSVVYDAGEQCWKARVIWRGEQFMKRARITGSNFDGLVAEAIKALVAS